MQAPPTTGKPRLNPASAESTLSCRDGDCMSHDGDELHLTTVTLAMHR